MPSATAAPGPRRLPSMNQRNARNTMMTYCSMPPVIGDPHTQPVCATMRAPIRRAASISATVSRHGTPPTSVSAAPICTGCNCRAKYFRAMSISIRFAAVADRTDVAPFRRWPAQCHCHHDFRRATKVAAQQARRFGADAAGDDRNAADEASNHMSTFVIGDALA